MSDQEEQPRPSLRLRKTLDRPPTTPPEPPKSPETKPETEEKSGDAPRPRLSAMIRPGDTATATPPTPPQPPTPPAPPPAQPTPPQPVAKPEPEKPPFSPFPEPAPQPEPAAAAPAPAAPPPPFVKPADQGLPVVEEPRSLEFPQDETPKAAPDPGPKVPSPRAVGLAIFGVLILVVGGVAYLLFMDPLGLFKKSETGNPPAVVTTPAAKPAPAATNPAVTQPAPSTTTTSQSSASQTAAPAPGDPDFKMPSPAPLQGGEEIAPGVVRLPRDASVVSATPEKVPEPQPYEPPAPKANPAYTALVNNLNITGIRENDHGGFLMVGGALYRPGDIVDQQNKLVFVGIDGPTITFKDPFGATYTRRF